MKSLKICVLTFVAGYSAALLSLEYRWGQDYVRNYFTDITGPVRFYAVNTTFSAFLLWSIAVMFGMSFMLTEEEPKAPRCLSGSLCLLFLYLGLDERFMLHEWWGDLLDKNDAYFVVLPGLMFVGVLYFWGDLQHRSWRTTLYLLCAAALFFVMLLYDVFVPDQMLWRLSLEDLTKLWSDIFLFLFAWEIFKQHVVPNKSRVEA
jgi:hypothetical protein